MEKSIFEPMMIYYQPYIRLLREYANEFLFTRSAISPLRLAMRPWRAPLSWRIIYWVGKCEWPSLKASSCLAVQIRETRLVCGRAKFPCRRARSLCGRSRPVCDRAIATSPEMYSGPRSAYVRGRKRRWSLKSGDVGREVQAITGM